MVVGVIGGGASGMAAALAAAENGKAQVILFERQARVGRKLLATGNGRCNLTNLHALERGYHGQNPAFSRKALESFGPEQTRQWFRSLGLLTVAEPSGRVYPYSDQANSVVDVLRFGLERANITLLAPFEVTKLRRTDEGFLVQGGEQSVLCHRVIVACGGLAGTKLGGSLSGYTLLSRMGHRATRLRPALVQIKADWAGLTGLKGVRANCRAAITRSGEVLAQSEGELQFTEYGLSGPVIFDISRDVCQGEGSWACALDFLPNMEQAELLRELSRRRETPLPSGELLTGLVHNRLGRMLTREAGICFDTPASALTDGELERVCRNVKNLWIPLTGTMGMDCAQVTAGGVLTGEFDPETMESRLVPGLYACGEVLDVDGDCGGYNLQWAWSSGRCAGLHAGKDGK